MSQADVLTWLQAHPGWHTRREMARSIGRSPKYFSPALPRLVELGEIESRVADGRTLEYRLA